MRGAVAKGLILGGALALAITLGGLHYAAPAASSLVSSAVTAAGGSGLGTQVGSTLAGLGTHVAVGYGFIKHQGRLTDAMINAFVEKLDDAGKCSDPECREKSPKARPTPNSENEPICDQCNSKWLAEQSWMDAWHNFIEKMKNYCATCWNTGLENCEKEDCTIGSNMGWYHMHRCTRPCTRCDLGNNLRGGVPKLKEDVSDLQNRLAKLTALSQPGPATNADTSGPVTNADARSPTCTKPDTVAVRIAAGGPGGKGGNGSSPNRLRDLHRSSPNRRTVAGGSATNTDTKLSTQC